MVILNLALEFARESSDCSPSDRVDTRLSKIGVKSFSIKCYFLYKAIFLYEKRFFYKKHIFYIKSIFSEGFIAIAEENDVNNFRKKEKKEISF